MDRFVIFLFVAALVTGIVAGRKGSKFIKGSRPVCPIAQCMEAFHSKMGLPIRRKPVTYLTQGAADIWIPRDLDEADADTAADLDIDVPVIPDIDPAECVTFVEELKTCIHENRGEGKQLCACRPRAMMALIATQENAVSVSTEESIEVRDKFLQKHCGISNAVCEVPEVEECGALVKEVKKEVLVLTKGATGPVTFTGELTAKIEKVKNCLENIFASAVVTESCKEKYPALGQGKELILASIELKLMGCKIPKTCIPKKPKCSDSSEEVVSAEVAAGELKDVRACIMEAKSNPNCELPEEFAEEFAKLAADRLKKGMEKKCEMIKKIKKLKAEIGCRPRRARTWLEEMLMRRANGAAAAEPATPTTPEPRTPEPQGSKESGSKSKNKSKGSKSKEATGGEKGSRMQKISGIANLLRELIELDEE